MVQRRTARFVTNRHRNTSSVSDIIDQLSWRPLAARQTDASLKMLYKISHQLVAIQKTDRLIPQLRLSDNMHSRIKNIKNTSTLTIILPSYNKNLEQSSIKHCNHERLHWVIQSSCLNPHLKSLSKTDCVYSFIL